MIELWHHSTDMYVECNVDEFGTTERDSGWIWHILFRNPKFFGIPVGIRNLVELLDADTANYFQPLIGVMRWMVEIGQIDIATEVSMLSSHLAMSCKGYLECALHMMSYLSKKHNSWLVFDPTYPDISWDDFPSVMTGESYMGLWLRPYCLMPLSH